MATRQPELSGGCNIVIVVVMGVSGSGKTTIGTRLAGALGCEFLDADSLHSAENIESMSRGIPLDDALRAPWLAAVRERMLAAFANDQRLVIACSALKERYRSFLAEGLPVTWIYLKGSKELIESRLANRINHFLRTEILASQIETLEEPKDAIVVDITPPPDAIVKEILTRLPAAG